MFETRSHCLVFVIAVLLPQSHSLDQDYTNPASSNTPLDNLRLAELAKTLAEASGLEDKCNETDPFSSRVGKTLLNISVEVSTTAKDQTATDKLVNVLSQKADESVSEVEKKKNELKSKEKTDAVALDKGKKESVFLKDSEQPKSTTRESSNAFKILEKRETDNIERTRENSSSALSSSDALVSNLQSDNYQHEEGGYQGSNLAAKGFVDDSDTSRMFRDVYEDASNPHTAEEKLQPEENSLFSKNQPSLIMKTKSRCSTCDDRMQKVVPDGNSFIELGSDHDEDDIIRKYQGMIFLIDNIIETAGGSSRKELGLCRKSKLADVACLLTNEEDKMEKTVLQIVSCVKDAMKDQMTTKSCIPLPRELHSFLIWLMHGSEGGGMCPPTVQESKSKPSYLFHEDNHRPHIAGGVFVGTPPVPSGSLLELISSNKAMPGQVGPIKAMAPSSQMLPLQQEQSEPILNMPPQYEVSNNQNNNINPQMMGDQQKVDLPYQRKMPFSSGRNFYRPLRSLQEECDRRSDVDYQRHEQANMAIRDPMEELMTYPEGSDPLYPNDSEYERKSRNVEVFATAPRTETDTSDREITGKTITKRDISRRKNVGNKNRENRSESKSSPRKKKRRDGAIKVKKSSQESLLDTTISNECLIDVQSLLQPSVWNEDKKVFSKNRKEKRKDKKKVKDVSRKDNQSKAVDNAYYSVKDEKGTNEDSKKEDNDSVKTSYSTGNNVKTNDDESPLREDLSDLEQESEPEAKSSSDAKPKKKKRKNLKSYLKDKYNRVSTEATFRGSTVNMSLGDLIPYGADVATAQPKKNKFFNHKDNYPGGKGFQVSFASKKCKPYRIKPNIVFEDELNKDSGIETEDDDYPEPEYEMSSFNEADEYEMNYSDDDNDPIDMYEDKDLVTSRVKSNHIVNNKEVKKKTSENRFKSKKIGHTTKSNRNVKQKKKPKSDKGNEKTQTNVKQNPPRTDNPQIGRGYSHEQSTLGTTLNVDNNEKEGSTETLQVVTSTDSSVYESNGDNQSGQEKTPNEGLGQDNKEGLEDPVKEFPKDKRYKLEQTEQGSNQEDTGSNSKGDKENKSENISDESQARLENVEKYSRKVTDVQNAASLENTRGLSGLTVKGKVYSKQVAKNKNNIQDNCRNTGQKRPDSKKKFYKVVSKVKKQPLTKSVSKLSSRAPRPRTVFGIKKSKVTRKLGSEERKISKPENIFKVQNDAKQEEDDEMDDDDQEELEDESYKDSEEESLAQVKPKNQMWADDENTVIGLLDSEGLSSIEEASNSETAVANRIMSNPVRTKDVKNFHVITNNKPPVTKETFLRVINSPTKNQETRNYPKERHESLVNVTNILKGVHMLGESPNSDASTGWELKAEDKPTTEPCTEKTTAPAAAPTTAKVATKATTMAKAGGATPTEDCISSEFEQSEHTFRTTPNPNSRQTQELSLDMDEATIENLQKTDSDKPQTTPDTDNLNNEDQNMQSDLVSFQNSLHQFFLK